ncbi:MAG: ABC transporter permease [Phycisphaeraceae bacterium]|nr:ABC transporter permease [Phycisphaeraceae bacterium]
MTSTPHHGEALHGDALLGQLRQGWKPLPNKTLFALAMGGLKVRMMRSVVTMLSIVLAIAFLTYTGLTNYLTRNLANGVDALAKYDPIDPAKVRATSAAIAGIDVVDGMPLEDQRTLAKKLAIDDIKAASDEVFTIPELIRNAKLARDAADKAVKDLQADKTTLPIDLVGANERLAAAQKLVDDLEARRRVLEKTIDFGTWIREGKSEQAQAMPAQLREALLARYRGLAESLPNPERLTDTDFEHLDLLLPLAWAKGGSDEDRQTVGIALKQEHRKRAATELRKLLTGAGVNIAKTRSGNPMDTWLIVMAMLTCAVGIANAMLMSVTERFREIGTMKCLGAQDNLVVKLFLLESAFLGIIGAALGIVLGLIVAWLAAVLQFKGYGIEYFPMAQSLTVILLSALGGIVLSVVGAGYPAFAASRMRPVDALRVDE